MLVVGNWKMHGRKVENEARLSFLAANLPANTRVSAAVCVPFPYLAQAEAALHASTVGLGVQDISAQSTGAFTGEVSAAMAADFGCGYAIIGHSERRSHHAESSSLIAAKAARATDHGLIPIVCVGETLEEREAGRTETVVTTQVIEILDLLVDASPENLVIAYEPLWAIGTGKSASGAEAQEVHACIRASLRERVRGLSGVRILYGGSVKASTAVDLFRQPDIDGALVGGASLDAAEFVQIWLAADCARRVEEHRSAVSSPAKDTQIAGSLHSPTDRR
ncbi:triose-phosphate isomerase [Paraburkholderia sp. Tr-20389]|nr:triose-phosphate isomerase [Paraburkholderia sp. Tr-20389]